MKLVILLFVTVVHVLTDAVYPFRSNPISNGPIFDPFTNGISLLGLRRLDPIYIDSVQIYENEFKLDLYNVQVTGLRNAKIEQISIDKNSRLMRIGFLADYTIKSQYSVGGYLLSLPIFGSGDFMASYIQMKIDMIIPFDIVKDLYGRDIIDLKSYKYSFDVKGLVRYHLTNLYNGNKQSSDRMLELINLNWKLLSAAHGRFVYDKVNDRVFNALRTYLFSQPLNTIPLSYFY